MTENPIKKPCDDGMPVESGANRPPDDPPTARRLRAAGLLREGDRGHAR